jgi:HlyD family secretion protein
MKRLALPTALCLIVITGCTQSAAGPVKEPTANSVRRGDLVQRIVLSGELDTHRGTMITVPRIPSWQTTIQWLADDGADVKKGDRIAELDASSLTSTLDEKRTTLREAEHRLAQQLAELRATVAEKAFEAEKWKNELEKARIKASLPRDLVSARDAAERDLAQRNAEKELAKATEALRAARIGAAADQRNLEIALVSARQEIARAESAIQTLTLTAPENGTVIFLDHPWEGRKLQVGDRAWVGLPLAKIPDLSTLEVVATLWDVDDGRVVTGDRATVTVDAYPEHRFSGRVVSVAPVAQESARLTLRRSFRTVIALDSFDLARMRPGLSTKVVIEKPVQRNTLLIPRAAVERFEGKSVVRIDGERRQITLGPCNSRECSVAGLEEGTRIDLPEAAR